MGFSPRIRRGDASFPGHPGILLPAVARYIPGTAEHESSRQEYIRRLRDVTAAKVEQFAELFNELSRSFREDDRRGRREEEAQLNYFLSEVMEGSCKMCRRYQQCWEKEFVKTYQGMTDLMAMVELHGGGKTPPRPPFLGGTLRPVGRGSGTDPAGIQFL